MGALGAARAGDGNHGRVAKARVERANAEHDGRVEPERGGPHLPDLAAHGSGWATGARYLVGVRLVFVVGQHPDG